jgi:hypothetical protein
MAAKIVSVTFREFVKKTRIMLIDIMRKLQLGIPYFKKKTA